MMWRLLDDGVGEAAWNMATDETLLESVVTRKMPPTLRLYSWNRPSVTLGRFQNVCRTLCASAYALPENTNCNVQTIPFLTVGERHLPVVRRISGGRGILHGSDLTLSLVATPEAIGLPSTASTRQIYARVADGLIRALGMLGITAHMGECQALHVAGASGDCFDIVSSADIVSAKDGRKLLGSALHRRGVAFLQQISIPFPTSREETDDMESLKSAVFSGHFPVEKSGKERYFEPSNIRAAFVNGLACSLELPIEPMSLTRKEVERTEELIDLRYLQLAWTWEGRDNMDLYADIEKTD